MTIILPPEQGSSETTEEEEEKALYHTMGLDGNGEPLPNEEEPDKTE